MVTWFIGGTSTTAAVQQSMVYTYIYTTSQTNHTAPRRLICWVLPWSDRYRSVRRYRNIVYLANKSVYVCITQEHVFLFVRLPVSTKVCLTHATCFILFFGSYEGIYDTRACVLFVCLFDCVHQGICHTRTVYCLLVLTKVQITTKYYTKAAVFRLCLPRRNNQPPAFFLSLLNKRGPSPPPPPAC